MTQAFNLSQLANKVNTSGQLDAATGLSGTTPVANGGTGAASLTANNVILGNGTSAVQTVAPSTSGNVLTSNGTTWVSASASASGALNNIQYFTTSGTYTATAETSYVIVEVVGGGGTSRVATNTTGIVAGATNSFGAFVSATGGGAGTTAGAAGGIGVSGDLNFQGQKGMGLANVVSPYGIGGVSFLGAVGSSNSTSGTTSIGTLNGYGGGGGGYARKKITSGFSGTTVTVGAAVLNAREGIVIVYEYK